jgi:hypothetical protein
LKRKFTGTVNKVKNLLRWNSNKGNFFEGTNTDSLAKLCDLSVEEEEDLNENSLHKLQAVDPLITASKIKEVKKVMQTSVFMPQQRNADKKKTETTKSETHKVMNSRQALHRNSVIDGYSRKGTQIEKQLASAYESYDPNLVEETFPEFMEYQEYHLKKSKVTLFELKDRIKSEVSMVIPFQLELPHDTKPSFD